MSLIAWVAIYILQGLWWLWLARWGGAQTIKGGWAAVLFGPFAHRWDAETIRLLAWLSLGATSLWFLLGLFEPAARFAYP